MEKSVDDYLSEMNRLRKSIVQELLSHPVEEVHHDWECFFQLLTDECAKLYTIYGLQSHPFTLSLEDSGDAARHENGHIIFTPYMLNEQYVNDYIQKGKLTADECNPCLWIETIVHELLHLSCEPMRPANPTKDYWYAEETLVENFTDKIIYDSDDSDIEQDTDDLTIEDLIRNIVNNNDNIIAAYKEMMQKVFP